MALSLAAASCSAGRRFAECEVVRGKVNAQLAEIEQSLEPPALLDAGVEEQEKFPLRRRAERYEAAQAALASLATDLSGLALMDDSVGASTRAYAETLERAADDCGQYAKALRRRQRAAGRKRRRPRRKRKENSLKRVVDQARKHLRLANAARGRLEKACSVGGLP